MNNTTIQLLISTRFIKSVLISLILLLFSNSFTYSLIFLSFLCFSFLFNDIIDFYYNKDKYCHPKRPLPSGKISIKLAFIYTILLLSLTIIFSIYYSHEIILFMLICSVLYSYFLKKYIPLFATIFWVFIVTFGFLYINNPDITIYITTFLIFYSREIILDLRDVKTDLIYCETKSLPAIIKDNTYILSFLLIFLSSIILFINDYVILSFVVLFVLFFILFVYLLSDNKLKNTVVSMFGFFPIILLV